MSPHSHDTVPLPRPLKQKIKDGIVVVSLANLFFINAWFRPLNDRDFGFFNNQPITNAVLLALLVNIGWLTAVFWLVIRAWRRWQNRWFHLAVHLAFLFLLFFPFDFFRAQMHPRHSLTSLLQQPVGMFVAAVLGALILWQHRWVARFAAIIVAILSPLALFNLGKIFLLCLGIIHLNVHQAPVSLPPLWPVREGHPRVVWIIFDEADYRMIFGQRPAFLQLPEFDRLRGESLCADNANSPNDKTIISMPSLVFGWRVSTATLTNSSELLVQFVIINGTFLCSQFPSVFSEARALGVNTALIGWYLPYAKLFGKDLNYCSWYPYPGFEPARASTFGGALLRQLECTSGTMHVRQSYLDMYQHSLQESLSLVTNATYGLTLLHLFPPHIPGIFLADKDRFTLSRMDDVTGYFNNLVLADHTLGKLRRALENSGEWETTWIIVSADHSWRGSPHYDGQRDYRVPFLVDPPGANGPLTYSHPFNTVITHDLILAILRGEITDTPTTAAWLDAHALPKSTVPGTLIEP